MNFNELLEQDINLALNEAEKIDNQDYSIRFMNLLKLVEQDQEHFLNNYHNCFLIGRLSGYNQAKDELEADKIKNEIKTKDEELEKLLSFKEINLEKVLKLYAESKPENSSHFCANDLSKLFNHFNGQIPNIALYMLSIGYLAGINEK